MALYTRTRLPVSEPIDSGVFRVSRGCRVGSDQVLPDLWATSMSTFLTLVSCLGLVQPVHAGSNSCTQKDHSCMQDHGRPTFHPVTSA